VLISQVMCTLLVCHEPPVLSESRVNTDWQLHTQQRRIEQLGVRQL